MVKDTTTQRYYLAGIVRYYLCFLANLSKFISLINLFLSRGAGCRGRGVYARVSTFEKWIDETISNN